MALYPYENCLNDMKNLSIGCIVIKTNLKGLCFRLILVILIQRKLKRGDHLINY